MPPVTLVARSVSALALCAMLVLVVLYALDKRRGSLATLQYLAQKNSTTYAGIKERYYARSSDTTCMPDDYCEEYPSYAACVCGDVKFFNPKYNCSGRRLSTACVSAHCLLNSMQLFQLPVGPSFNLDIEAYNQENTFILGTCSGKASTLELGG